MSDILHLLPVGSVVYLKGGKIPIVIVSVGVVAEREEPIKPLFVDYCGAISPDGYDPDKVYYFNQENIDRVIFRGMDSFRFERYLKTTKKQLKKALKKDLVELWEES